MLRLSENTEDLHRFGLGEPTRAIFPSNRRRHSQEIWLSTADALFRPVRFYNDRLILRKNETRPELLRRAHPFGHAETEEFPTHRRGETDDDRR